MSQLSKQLNVNLDPNVIELQKKFLKVHYESRIKHKKGIVFIGNSRIGKSTISATIGGIKMLIIICDGELRIQPAEQKYKSNKNIIQHTFTSVTEFPNIYEGEINGELYTLVDLPGFKDTSYEKQLCNWHYIKSILSQLQKILFVMVIQVHSEKMEVDAAELEMMHRLAEAFSTKNANSSKENLVVIVNFMENINTQQQQLNAKNRIKQQVLSQLRKEGLQKYYSSSFAPSKLFLLRKATKQNRNLAQFQKGVPFNSPELLTFIKKNVLKLQETQPSHFKINLTKERNAKSEQLRRVIVELSQRSINNIGEKFLTYKKLLAYLLKLMAQTDGAKCSKEDFRGLQNFYKENELQVYEEIRINQVPTAQLNLQSLQEIAYLIVSHFHAIGQNKQEQFKTRIVNLQNLSFKFIDLMLNLCRQLFSSEDFLRIQEISENIKKSIYVECYNLNYFYDSVQNFDIESSNSPDTMFQEDCNNTVYQMYRDYFVRISNFKQELTKYFEKLINIKEQLPSKKLNIESLLKLKQACQIFNLSQFNHQSFILFFKTCHGKLQDPFFSINPLKLYEASEKCLSIQIAKKDELEKLQKWKQTSKEWQQMKNKNFIILLNHITKTGFDCQKLFKFYMKLDSCFEGTIEILKKIILQVKNEQFLKDRAYSICLEAYQHMVDNWEYENALVCCKLAQGLYQYEDEKKKIQAKMLSIKLRNLLRKQLNETQILQKLTNRPWTNITDIQYQQILLAMKQTRAEFEKTQQKANSSSSQIPENNYLIRGSRSPMTMRRCEESKKVPIKIK